LLKFGVDKENGVGIETAQELFPETWTFNEGIDIGIGVVVVKGEGVYSSKTKNKFIIEICSL
jgi:hypothetical protein